MTQSSDDFRWGRYIRVSSAEQAGPDSASVDTQLNDTGSLIAKEGGELVDTYQDTSAYRDAAGRMVQPSGERADRPDWLRMIADLRTGRINAIASWHEWRLYRDYRPFVDFIEVARARGTIVRLVHGLWSEQFAVFGAWMGRADNTHRRLQTQKGIHAKARKGFPMTTASPFYQVVRDDKGKRTGYILRPDMVDWLQRLANLFTSRHTYAQMAAELAVNPVTGSPAQESSIRAILVNPFFRGRIEPNHWRGAPTFSIEGVQPPAWDDATCLAIEAELARRAQVGRSSPHHGRFLFSGLLRCGICGRLMTGALREGRLTPQYACPLGARFHRPQPIDRGRSHPYNSASEKTIRRKLKEVGVQFLRQRAADGAGSDTAAQFMVPGTSLKGPSPESIASKRSELTGLESEYEQTPAGNTRVRHWLEGEIERTGRELEALEREAARVADPALIATVVEADLYEFFESDILDAPAEVLRPALLRRFPAIWYCDGKLSKAPKELWINPKRAA